MTPDLIAFLILALVAIISAIGMLVSKNTVYSALFLILNFATIALFYLFLGAPFLAMIQVTVYAGAIMVLLLFVIMLLNLGPGATDQERQWLSAGMWVGPGLLAFVLVLEFVYLIGSGLGNAVDLQAVGLTSVPPKQVGISLFGTYLLGVELAGMLLLAGLVGAFHIGRRI